MSTNSGQDPRDRGEPAYMCAASFLAHAIADVSGRLGRDAPIRHPQLIAAYVHAAALGLLAHEIRTGLDRVADALVPLVVERAGEGEQGDHARPHPHD
jgi:hypothetical protein